MAKEGKVFKVIGAGFLVAVLLTAAVGVGTAAPPPLPEMELVIVEVESGFNCTATVIYTPGTPWDPNESENQTFRIRVGHKIVDTISAENGTANFTLAPTGGQRRHVVVDYRTDTCGFSGGAFYGDGSEEETQNKESEVQVGSEKKKAGFLDFGRE